MNGIRKNILAILISSCPVLGVSQNFTPILQSVEQHSTLLKAERMKADAENEGLTLENRLEDPELGVNYLWGSKDIGNRLDLSLSQSFDFPTVYAQRKKLIAEMQRVNDLLYLSERQKLMVSAKKLCIQVVYCNALMEHLDEDLEATQALADAYQKLFDKGEATIIDRNKAQQAFLFFKAEYDEFHNLRNNLLAELRCLNGGEVVDIADKAFVHEPLPADFEQWMAGNLDSHPEMQMAHQKVISDSLAANVARNGWWPKFRVGYMSEKTDDEHFLGLSAGLSVPVWSASRKTKVAKAKLAASQLAENDLKIHLQTQLRSVYNDALTLEKTLNSYTGYLQTFDNSNLLKKSLDAGQITLVTYLQEIQYVHEMHEKAYAAARDLELRKAELYIVP